MLNSRAQRMNAEQRTRTSKFLSLHLRHRPDLLGIQLEPGGWVDINVLLNAAAQNAFPLSRDDLAEVVATSDKQRFSFDPSGTRIRANQGHSVAVDLQLAAQEPPAVLYHGTGVRAAHAISREGLRKMSRHHVHLSTDIATARRVGARHGTPIVYRVDAAAMHAQHHTFFCADNGVWLTEAVPPEFLTDVTAQQA
jgi:putative RNA 2'-phosphotransferase